MQKVQRFICRLLKFHETLVDVYYGYVCQVAVLGLDVVFGPEEFENSRRAYHHNLIIITFIKIHIINQSCNLKMIKPSLSILLSILVLLALIHSTLAWKQSRTFKFKNSASQTIWIGGFGVPLMSPTGWQMAPNTEYSVNVPANTVAIRYWARTGCNWVDGKFICSTGDCGAPLNNFGLQCGGVTGQSPATLIQLTLSNSGSPDFYDLSNVDGNNLNARFGPIQGTYTKVDNPDLGKFNCGSPSCTFDQSRCPPELTLQRPDGSYCMSICAAVFNADQVNKYPDILGPIASDPMKRDLVCCACGEGTGGCTDPNSHYCCSPYDPRTDIGGRCYVQEWPKPSAFFDRYDRVFKDQCEQAYSWQFDDLSSTYQCIDADYEIEFYE